MKIVIACSKKWFHLNEKLKKNNHVVYINSQIDLTEDALLLLSPDLIFFPHWNWVVPESIYQNFNCIGFHTAPLPYGRGGSPIQNLILAGFTQSPICAIEITSELDGGGIYAKREIKLDGSLEQIFFRMNKAVNSLIEEIIENRPDPKSQKGSAHYFRRLNNADNEIPLNLPLNKVCDRIRMLDDPSYPKAFLKIGDYKLEFSKVVSSEGYLSCESKISKAKLGAND